MSPVINYDISQNLRDCSEWEKIRKVDDKTFHFLKFYSIHNVIIRILKSPLYFNLTLIENVYNRDAHKHDRLVKLRPKWKWRWYRAARGCFVYFKFGLHADIIRISFPPRVSQTSNRNFENITSVNNFGFLNQNEHKFVYPRSTKINSVYYDYSILVNSSQFNNYNSW